MDENKVLLDVLLERSRSELPNIHKLTIRGKALVTANKPDVVSFVDADGEHLQLSVSAIRLR